VRPTIEKLVPTVFRLTNPRIRPNRLERNAKGTKIKPRLKMPNIPKQLPSNPRITP
jgi:hypothetical protein